MAELASRARVKYGVRTEGADVTFKQVPAPTALQARAYEPLGLLSVAASYK
jgi:hypothetical protein